MKNTLVFAILTSLSLSAWSQDTGELVIHIENIKKIEGSMMVALYDDKELFLSLEVVRSDGKGINDEMITFSFKGLDHGVYAVSIFQDENNNGKLDANFMGIPSDPYAFSNNAKGLFGPPDFDDCKFELAGSQKKIIITL